MRGRECIRKREFKDGGNLPSEMKPLMFPKGGPIVSRSATRNGDAF